MENAEDKLLGMNRTHLAILMAIFMINSCILTLVFGPYLITYTDYFRHLDLVFKTNEGVLGLVLYRFAALVQISFCAMLIPTAIAVTANKLISVIKHAIRGKAY